MPLSAAVLGPLLQSNIDALSNAQKANRAAVFQAMAAAIITHITTAGVVNVTVVGTSATGGPVTGTGTGTVT